MITVLNSNNQLAYVTLFGKAYDVLLKNGYINEGDTINSLDDYFFHLNDLINENNLDVNGNVMTQAELFKFLMLPLDEPTLDIDINSRNIKVPAAFAKCAGVQGDHYAETVMFTVDRYADYMDLDNTVIYVQWETPETEGASQVFLKDLETVPNKLRFGWVLEDPITSTPGNVKFSVKFFHKNDNGELTYSLNTLTSEIAIKPALKADINYDEEAINNREGENVFRQFIVNSINASYEIPNAPSFLHSAGLNLPVNAALDENNTLTLKAQAITGDMGVIDYYWYYKPHGAEEYELRENVDAENLTNGYYIADEYVQVEQANFKPAIEKYYVKGMDDSGRDIYTLTGLSEYPADKNIYERYTTYVIPNSEVEVVGNYMVKATNTRSVNVTNKVASNVCKMLAPNPIEITKALETGAQISDTTKDVKLEIEIKPDENLPTVSYAWKYSATSSDLEDLIAIPDAKSNSYIAMQPGWYTVGIEALLNRKVEKAGNDVVCKVTGRANIDGVAVDALNEGNDISATTGEAVSMSITAIYTKPEAVTLADELVHDDFKYVWQTFSEMEDTDFRDIVEADTFVVSGLNSNNLVVLAQSTQRQYRCKVYNVVNGLESIDYVTTNAITVY